MADLYGIRNSTSKVILERQPQIYAYIYIYTGNVVIITTEENLAIDENKRA